MSPRTPPSIQPPALVISDSGLRTEIRRYKISTLLFGGGVRAGENDEQQLIRATSIRGQLRFWWRACCGGSETDATIEGMRAREIALWGGVAGGTPTPSPVRIEVQVHNTAPEKVAGKDISKPSSPYSYAGFPLRNPGQSVLRGIEFTLKIHYPPVIKQGDADRNIEREIKATLWAWQLFGGIGARTRRGFGALERMDLLPNPNHFTAEYIRNTLEKLILPTYQWPAQVPHLHPQMRLCIMSSGAKSSFTEAEKAWLFMLDLYKSFRQQRAPGPGRSYWPEADTIRAITRQAYPDHREPVTIVGPFPRAAFGLPINFQFHPDDRPKTSPWRDRDPDRTVLKPQNSDRFASPVIIKPLSTPGIAVGLIAVLEGSSLDGIPVVLKHNHGSKRVPVVLTLEEASSLEDKNASPLFPENTVDPFDALFAFLKKFDSTEDLG